MENKKSTLATVLLLIAVLVIGALAGYIYMQKIETDKKIADLEEEISQKQEVNEEPQEKEKSKEIEISYNKNFAKNVFNELDENAEIVVPIWAYSGNSQITINNKKEAYWYNEGNDTFPETSNEKVADNVINAWYCPLGQDIESNACILFLKDDGKITYIRFFIDEGTNGVSFVNCTEEQTLEEINSISNVLVVENGFYGAIFIKEDGTTMSMPLTKLDDLTNPKK